MHYFFPLFVVATVAWGSLGVFRPCITMYQMTLWKCSTNRIQWNNVTSDNKSPRWHIYTCMHAVIHTVTFAQYLPREREGWRDEVLELGRWEMKWMCHTQTSILDHNGGYFFFMMDSWAYQLWALMTPVITPLRFLVPSGLHRLPLSKWILWSQHVRGIFF